MGGVKIFSKQTQPRIMVNQQVSAMCMDVERNRENQKQEKDNQRPKWLKQLRTE